MAGPFYVDDGGDGTTESSWATADISISDLDAEYALASGEIVYFGHDHAQAGRASALTIVGPTAGAPVSFISATQGSDPPTYAASTTSQIQTNSTYNITFDGSFALYGISVVSGDTLVLTADLDESFIAKGCRFAVGANKFILTSSQRLILIDCVVDLAADGTTTRSAGVFQPNVLGRVEIHGMSFENAGYRTGSVFASNASDVIFVSGSDFSGFTQSGVVLLSVASAAREVTFNNCLTHSSWTPVSGTTQAFTRVMMTNVGPANAPTYMYLLTYFGSCVSSSAIYRTGGATVEATACGWLVTTESRCSEGSPFYTPWIYGTVASTGSKTFTVYITNDTGDFTDAEAWLEVESLGTASEAQFDFASDQRTITTTATAQTDDTGSTWNGAGPSFTYKQSLAVTATVNVAGLYRARVCVGVASIAGSRYFYVDPKVTVS